MHELFVLLIVGFVALIIWKSRHSNMAGRQEPAIAADYARAGFRIRANWLFGRRTVRGALQSTPFELTLYRGGKGVPPVGTLVVQGADGPDFSLAREWNDMRAFLRLGSGHALQTGDEGIEDIDAVLPTGAERDAARALFRLGFDKVSRRGGSVRTHKLFLPELPELEILGRALVHLEGLRGNRGRMPEREEKR